MSKVDARKSFGVGGENGGVSGPWLPRIHFYEINDQHWWPPLLRGYVQDYLTLGWTVCLPLIQRVAPCALAASVLTTQLGSYINEYAFIDFCSGSGGPTPFFEKIVNQTLRQQGKDEVRFVMTDIEPNVEAWQGWCKKSKSGRLGYVKESVDATSAPDKNTLLGNGEQMNGAGHKRQKVMRLFSLAFHHFDDDMARKVLRDTMDTSEGFCIFELQARNLSSFILITLLWPLAMLVLAPTFFYNSPARLFFTYLVPWVPFVWVFDGYISCLRTRTPAEVQALMRQSIGSQDELRHWKIRSGEETHTFPIGKMHWFIATKEDR